VAAVAATTRAGSTPLLRSGRWDDPITGFMHASPKRRRTTRLATKKTPQRRKRAAIFCLNLATERPRKGRASGKFCSYLDDEGRRLS
jgi:hypothetical protein